LQGYDRRGVIVGIRSRALPTCRIQGETVLPVGNAITVRVSPEGIHAPGELVGVRDSVTVHVGVGWADPCTYGGTVPDAVAVGIWIAGVGPELHLLFVRQPVAVRVGNEERISSNRKVWHGERDVAGRAGHA